MKEKLIEILGLPTNADEGAIVGAVGILVSESKRRDSASAVEKKIAKKIADSGGALSRDQAIMALEHQEKADAQRAKAKK